MDKVTSQEIGYSQPKLLRVRILAFACLASVLATYFAISSGVRLFDWDGLLWLVILDLILLLALVAVVARRVVQLILERKKESVGSRLQTRVVMMFSLVAIVPTVVMAIFSAILFNYGTQSWFDKKVGGAVEASVAIAESYLEEHKKNIQLDIRGMASDLNRDAPNIRRDPRYLNKKVTLLASIRKLPEAIVFQHSDLKKTILGQSAYSFSLGLILEDLSEDILQRAENGELVTVTAESDDRVISLIRLDNFFDTYLLVGRFVDNRIINYIALTEGAASEYKNLKSNISELQVNFLLVFLMVSLLLLLAVIWFGINFAAKMVLPLRSLVSATEKVKSGNLAVRVEEGHEKDEIATLGRAFNLMTEQLARQRKDLISAQRRSAWSDVARRIAHEIKNPLTPIQLATDRLKRKYSSTVEDKEVFSKYLTTIATNVENIGNMVDEFSRFARMPAPSFASHNIVKLLREVIFSRETSDLNIVYDTHIPNDNVMVYCDSGQIVQVVTNLCKNAEEALEEVMHQKPDYQGHITVDLLAQDGTCYIEICDNGSGFPTSMLDFITEPYVTTKSKGTGLGLAIVKKIIEEHKGSIEFLNYENGARVKIELPLEKKDL